MRNNVHGLDDPRGFRGGPQQEEGCCDACCRFIDSIPHFTKFVFTTALIISLTQIFTLWVSYYLALFPLLFFRSKYSWLTNPHL